MKNTWLKAVSATVILAGAIAGAARANEAPAAAQPAGDAKAGEAKAGTVCMACHGPMGNSVVPAWPKLAGQNPAYILKQLADFKAGARQNAQMSPMAAPLTPEDMANVAAYYSAQTQNGGKADPAQAALGEVLYRAGNAQTGVPACSGCHGPEGLGANLARFPRIAGQHAAYTQATLGLFRDGKRANDPNGMMRGVAAHMTDQEMAAVAQYVQGLAH